MIAIKGMEMPKGCKNCLIGCGSYTDLIAFQKHNPEDYANKRLETCRLVDLGKEDMSWDELVEKVRNYNKIYIPNDISFIRLYQICFNRIGDIFFLNDKRLKKTPFQMYQIIKSLVGDER